MWREVNIRRAMLFSLDKRERERDERDNTFRSSVYTAHAFACQGRG
jgi:hypothetical protein